MKNILERRFSVLLIAVIVTIAALIFAGVVLTMVLTLLGNLAIWPILGAALIGQPITFGMAMGIAVVMAVVIFVGCNMWPERSDRFFEVFGAILSIGFMSTLLMAIAGTPAYLILLLVFGPPVSGWLILPLGIGTLIVLQWIGSLKNTPVPKEHVGTPVKPAQRIQDLHGEAPKRETHQASSLAVPDMTKADPEHIWGDEGPLHEAKVAAPTSSSGSPLSGGHRPFSAAPKPPDEAGSQ